MKKVLSLVLALLIFITVLCGCTEEHSVKVSQNGKTKISVLAAIPVETVEALMAESDSEEVSADEEVYYEELEQMEIRTIEGVKCYVQEEGMSFYSTKKANKYMLETYGEDAGGYFKTFAVSTKQFEASIVNNIAEVMELIGGTYTLKLNVTLPYVVTKTNGSLSDDKKTVTFNLAKGGKLYAYTTKSDNSAKIYFKKDYLKSNSSAYISWNSVKGASKYKLQYKANGDKNWKTVTTAKTARTVYNLKAGKKYTFKVTAITKSKEYTSMKTYITPLKKVEATVKAKTAKTIKLGWKKNTNADGYIVYMKTSKSGEWKSVKTIKDPYTASYTVKNLKSDKKYYFKVVSFSNENGKKIKSSAGAISVKTK